MGGLFGGRDRRRHAAMRAVLGPPRSAEDLAAATPKETVTVEGRLVATGEHDARVVSFHPFGTSYLEEPNHYAVTESRGAFELAVGDVRLVLDGPFQVLVGGVESEHDARALKGARFGAAVVAAREDLRTRAGQFRVLTPGMRVRVRGRVTPAPDDDAGYRGRTRVFRLEPASENAPVLLAAMDPPETTGGGRPRAWAALGLASLLAGALALAARRAPTPAPAMVAPGPPVCRAQVVEALAHNHLDAAALLAADCADPRSKAFAAFANGRFEAASSAFAIASVRDADLEPSLSEAEAHLFAHQPARAASTIRRMIARFYPGPETDEKRALMCIARQVDLLAERGLAEPYARPFERDHCGGPRVGTEIVRRFAEEMEDEGGLAGGFEHFAPGYDAVANPFGVIAPRRRLRARPVGIENRLLSAYVTGQKPPRHPRDRQGGPYGNLSAIWEETAGDRWARLSAFAAELALFYAFHGAADRTQPLFEVLDRVAAALERSPYRPFFERTPMEGEDESSRAWVREMQHDERLFLVHVMAVAAGAAQVASDTARMERYAALGDRHASAAVTQLARMTNREMPWETPIEDAHWHDHVAVFEAATGGDAARVVDVLDAQHVTGAETLPRVAPRLTSNREALGTWFRTRFPAPCTTCGASELAGHLADRRLVAEVLGEPREGALDDALRGFVDALTDPAVAYEVDALERFFVPKR